MDSVEGAARRIPVQELGEGEPDTGGIDFVEALDEYVPPPTEDEWNLWCKIRFGDDECVLKILLERAVRDWKIEKLKALWRAGEFVAFAYPVHDTRAYRRQVLPSALADRLTFTRLRRDRGGESTDAYILEPREDGFIAIKRRPEDQARRFCDVLLYRSRPQDAGTSTPYGQKSAVAKQWIERHRGELMDLPGGREARARMVATNVGCSFSLARTVLKDENL
jgi:hypothetical protein